MDASRLRNSTMMARCDSLSLLRCENGAIVANTLDELLLSTRAVDDSPTKMMVSMMPGVAWAIFCTWSVIRGARE